VLIDLPDQLVSRLFSRPLAFAPGKSQTENLGPLLHAVIGMSGEAGELIDTVKKAWAYSQPLDKGNLIEELGDSIFYWIAACQEAGVHPQTAIDRMVAKLSARYPTGEFSPTDAAERKDKQ